MNIFDPVNPAPWEQISEAVRPRIAKFVRDVREAITGDKSITRFLTRRSLLHRDRLEQVLKQRCDQWVQQVYDICCSEWSKLRKVRHAEFAGSVWTYELEPFVEEHIPELLFLALRFGKDKFELLRIDENYFFELLENESERFLGDPDAESAYCDALMVKHVTGHIRHRWEKKIEAEQKRLGSQPSKSVEAHVTSLAVQPKARRPTDPRKIEIATIKGNNPGLSCLGICMRMDGKQEHKPALGPLDTWIAKSGERTWTGCYRNKSTTSPVQKYISKVKPAGL